MPTRTYDFIGSVTTAGNTSIFSFTNIPQQYSDLVMTGVGYTPASDGLVFLELNLDTTAGNYQSTIIGATRNPNGSTTINSTGVNNRAGATYSSGQTSFTCNFMSYSSNGLTKTSLVQMTTGYESSDLNNIIWANTTPITSISFTASQVLSNNTTFTLYGIVG
jgi:hypothetical protein